MNRTDRLHALREELRRAGPRGRTAAHLASWLEVSTRTIKRDVSALQQAGLPVWARSGPGGGYVLDARATLAPVNLTPAQAIAVATALATQPDAPYATDGRVAFEKVLDVMAPADRRRVEELGVRIWIRREGSTSSIGAAVTGCLSDALATRRVVVLTYDDASGRATQRRVEPHMLARRDDHWYLLGWCQQRQAPRWFRFDRIRAAHLTKEPVVERDTAIFGTPPDEARPVRRGGPDCSTERVTTQR